MMNFGQIFRQIVTNSFLLFIFLLSQQTRISRTEEQANDATVDKLNVPVAFPIYRPPLETVQRQKTSVENVQRQPLRFHSLPQHPVPAMAPASPPFSPSNLTAGHVEEISGQGSESSFASPEEATEEEETENQNHRDADGDEQPFLAQKSTSTVPAVTVRLGKENADSSSVDESATGTRNNGNGNSGKGGKTKGPMKMSKSAGSGIESILPTTAATAAENSQLTAADRRLHPQQQQQSASSARPVSVINTPQFQLFTGMGMEIIDSREGSNEQSTPKGTTISASSLGQNNAAGTKEEAREEEEEDGHHHHKMLHYNRAESNASSNHGSPIQMVHLSTLGASTSTTAKSPSLISSTFKTKTSMDSVSSDAEKASTSVPIASSSTLRTLTSSTVRSDAAKLKTSSIDPAEGEEKADEAFKTEATAKLPTILSTTGVPTSDEVTEDLLAMLNHSPPSPPPFASAKNQSSAGNVNKKANSSSHFMPTPPNKPPTQFPVSAESNDQFSHQIGLSGGHDELDAGFERQTQQIPPGAEIEGVNGSGQRELAQTTPSSPNNEHTNDENVVLTRPMKPPIPQHSMFWSTTAGPPSNENIASDNSTRIFTRFPLLWTSTIAQNVPENPTKFTTTPATKFETTTTNGFGQHWQPIGAKTTTENEQPQPTTFNWGGRISPSIKATTTEWPMGNHLGETEEEEEHEPTEGENQPTMSSSTQKSTLENEENGNFGNNGGSRIGAENVHNGEENVQSSEASSKFSSSTIHHQPTSNLRVFIIGGIILAVLITVIAGSVCTAKYVKKSRQLHGKYRPAAYEMQTQHQHRFQQPDYVQHIIPSSNSISQPPNQQQTAIFNGKEERLI